MLYFAAGFVTGAVVVGVLAAIFIAGLLKDFWNRF